MLMFPVNINVEYFVHTGLTLKLFNTTFMEFIFSYIISLMPLFNG